MDRFVKEIWKAIPDYKGIYEVSNLGRVKRLERTYERKYKGGVYRMRKLPEIILKQSDNSNGYKYVGLSKKGTTKREYIHRLVLKAFVGSPNENECNHINGIKSDNRLRNLEWVSKSENGKHAYKLGLNKVTDYQKEQTSKANRGSGHGSSILNEDDIIEIREMRKSGMTYQEISDEFNVCRQSIGYIIRGKTWTHVRKDRRVH